MLGTTGVAAVAHSPSSALRTLERRIVPAPGHVGPSAGGFPKYDHPPHCRSHVCGTLVDTYIPTQAWVSSQVLAKVLADITSEWSLLLSKHFTQYFSSRLGSVHNKSHTSSSHHRPRQRNATHRIATRPRDRKFDQDTRLHMRKLANHP